MAAHDRLTWTRYPDDVDNDDWVYGTNRAYLQSFVGHWRTAYDWRRHEAAINALPRHESGCLCLGHIQARA